MTLLNECRRFQRRVECRPYLDEDVLLHNVTSGRRQFGGSRRCEVAFRLEWRDEL